MVCLVGDAFAHLLGLINIRIPNIDLACLHILNTMTIFDHIDYLFIVKIVPKAIARHHYQITVLNFMREFICAIRQFVIGSALVRCVEAPLLHWRVEGDLVVAVNDVAAVAEVEALQNRLVFVEDHGDEGGRANVLLHCELCGFD